MLNGLRWSEGSPGGWGGGTALGKVSMRKGVESEKDQGCLGAVRRNAGIGPMDIM